MNLVERKSLKPKKNKRSGGGGGRDVFDLGGSSLFFPFILLNMRMISV